MSKELIVIKQEGKKQEGKKEQQDYMSTLINVLKNDLKKMPELKECILEFNNSRKSKELNQIQKYLFSIDLIKQNEILYFSNTVSVYGIEELEPLLNKVDFIVGVCIQNNLLDIEQNKQDFSSLNAKIRVSENKLNKALKNKIFKNEEDFDENEDIKISAKNVMLQAKKEKNKLRIARRNALALELELEAIKNIGKI